MIRINLLPWREQLREERKRQFLMVLVLTVVAAGALVFLAGQYVTMHVNTQIQRNKFLEDKISLMNERIKIIQELKDQKAALLARAKIIQDLQSDRQMAARLLEQFVLTLPDGIFYTSLAKQDKTISISGDTTSNNKVSQLMRNFERSDWLADPNLTAIVRVNEKDPVDKTARFTLMVRESMPAGGDKK